jgi:hypothetical protein
MNNEMKETHLQAGEWYAVTDHMVCCDCHLEHKVEYRRVDGHLQYRLWRVDDETKKHRTQHYGAGVTKVLEELFDEPWQGRA